jgi:hypothetical protein
MKGEFLKNSESGTSWLRQNFAMDPASLASTISQEFAFHYFLDVAG